jgi:geranylgeranyl diphosphate synthase type II
MRRNRATIERLETMPKYMHISDSLLSALINERGSRILEKFRQTIVSGVSHPSLLSILTDVKKYWKDNYRPALTSFSCEAVGGQPAAADDASLMITLLSAGLGIHDDIIDKSQNKHFRMTILGLHGVENALLAGDLFIVKALTTSRGIIRNCSSEKAALVVDAFENFFVEVWEGEYMEIQCRKNLETELDDYQRVLWKSTADTEACARLGAFFGNGSHGDIGALAEFGRRLGYMFRLSDDMNDSLNTEGNLCNRLENESIPLPILFAAKYSKSNFVQIRSILQKTDISPPDAQKILELCFDSGALSYVQGLAQENSARAISKLRLLKRSFARNALEAMMKKSLLDTLKLTC